MESLPLPPRPNFEHYQRRAKDLVKAAKSAKSDAVHAWASDWLGSLAKALGVTVDNRTRSALDEAIVRIEKRVRAKVDGARAANEDFTLADAQFLIASAHGF